MCLFSTNTVAMTSIYFEKNQEIKKKLTDLIYQYNIPGAVITYGFKEQPLQTIAIGLKNIHGNVVMKDNALFMTGSITKSFIAVAILNLIEEKKIREDETLEIIGKQYGGKLKHLLIRYPTLSKVTVRQLLVHTSGVPEDINTSNFLKSFVENPKNIWTDDQLLAIAMQRLFYFKPGTPGAWSYTNTDYLLLGVVIDTVADKSVADVLENLWKKAGLKHIYYASNGVIPKKALNNMAVGYIDVAGTNDMQIAFKNQPQVIVPGKEKYVAYSLNNAYNIFGSTSSGIITDTATLAKWYRAIFEGKLFNQSGINRLLNGVSNGKYNQAKYALGVATHVTPDYGYVVSHDGLSPGYSLIVMYFFKYDLVISLATNSSNLNVSTFNVHDGQLLPGIISPIMSILVGKNE